MFTGIVEEVGEIVRLRSRADGVRLTVRGPVVVDDAVHGASIAVNGCCLTVTDHDHETFTVDLVAESLARTSLGALVVGSPVNLERAVMARTRLGGHIVQGHVDGTGTVAARQARGQGEVIRIAMPHALARYVAEKGSVAVDGVSLTVSAVIDGPEPAFEVSLIPTTLADTTLGGAPVGSVVNLEVDVVAKYVERLTSVRAVQP